LIKSILFLFADAKVDVDFKTEFAEQFEKCTEEVFTT